MARKEKEYDDDARREMDREIRKTLQFFQRSFEDVDIEALDLKNREPGTAELPENCAGSAGTYGTLTGCFGTFGSFGCLGATDLKSKD